MTYTACTVYVSCYPVMLNVQLRCNTMLLMMQIFYSSFSSYFIQRRVSDSVDFYRPWDDYAAGFGNLDWNLWLGLEHMHLMTSTESNTLKVEMEAFDGTTVYAVYDTFIVGDSASEFLLTVGGYSGTAGDSLAAGANAVNGMKFSTYDNENDLSAGLNCAVFFNTGFWSKACFRANPNGPYVTSNPTAISLAQGITWLFKDNYESLKTMSFKITPSA